MIVVLVVIIIVLLSVIFCMNMKFRRMKEIHLQRLEDLHLIILDLTKNQKINQEKIQLADEFKTSYNNSKQILGNKIIVLQNEFLEILSKNNLIG